MTGPESVAAELDERHRAANRAYAARDLAAYGAMFSPTLVYRQADGRTIDRDRLMRHVAGQFRSLSRAESSYARQAIRIDGDTATETLTQTATGTATAFGFIHRSWSVTRQGDYRWIRPQGLWIIDSVIVHAETSAPTGWRLDMR